MTEHAVPGAPLVVLVHGSLDRSGAFSRCVGHLRDLHTIRYDRRGYGRSIELGAPPVSGHVEDLIGVMDERPGVVVGHSIGGTIALAAAQLRPDLIRAVGAYEAPMPWLESWPSHSAGGEAMAMAPDSSADAAGDAAERFLRRMIGDRRWDELPEASKLARRAEGRALLAELQSARATPSFDVAAIKVPVVVGHSTLSKDHHRWAARELADSVSAELIVIDGAYHGAHVTHHAEFADFVRRVVAKAAR